jgi:hypothetical protein
MANAIPLHVTIDHAVIRVWADRRGGRPATFMGDARPWPLRFDFGSPDAGVKEIEWQRFFAEFERAKLAFVYRDRAPNGEPDDYHEFVHRSTVPDLTVSRKSTMIEYAV